MSRKIYSATLNQASPAVDTGDKELLASFLKLFPYRIESSVKRAGAETWRPVSRFHHVSDQEIIDSIGSESKTQRALSFDVDSKFLVILIPSSSEYHSLDFLDHVKTSFHELGIEIVPYQFEEDWYLYIFFSEPVSTKKYSAILKHWFEAAQIQIGPNKLEITPFERPVPVPLQPGFSWIGTPAIERNKLPLQDAIKSFLNDTSRASVSPDIFEQVHSTVLKLESEKHAVSQDEDLQNCQLYKDADLSSADSGTTSATIEAVSSLESHSEVVDLNVELPLQPKDENSHSVETESPDEERAGPNTAVPQLFLFPDHPTPPVPSEPLDHNVQAGLPNNKDSPTTEQSFPQLSLFPEIDSENANDEVPSKPNQKKKKDSKKAGRAPPDTG